MVTNGEKPQARPLFRKLALGMAIVLFLLAAAFALAPIVDNNGRTFPREARLLGVGSCLFLGFAMLAIGRTGRWPPPAKR
jgi:hypothetical protein